MSGDKRKAAQDDGHQQQQQRPRVEVKQIACECDAAWRAAWPDLDAAAGFEGNLCVVGSRRLAQAIQKHHFAARADEKGRAPPDLAAANRFACYGALAATMASEHKGFILLCSGWIAEGMGRRGGGGEGGGAGEEKIR